MSRAFVKEDDGDDDADLPPRAVPAHANYVTPYGLVLLQARLRDLTREHAMLAGDDSQAGRRRRRREIERDLRYFGAQVERAEVVAPQAGSGTVRFGDRVEMVDDDGTRHRYRIVGDDEADAAAGDISWASPLAKALLGARVGDVVTWQRPAGAVDIEVIAILTN